MKARQEKNQEGAVKMSQSDKPEMLTIPQLEKLQILPGRAIRRLVAEKKIPAIKVGNRQYINFDVFKRYLAGESTVHD